MLSALSPSSAVLRAVANATLQSNSLTVVKLGGSALEDATAKADMLASLVALQRLGLKLVAVHGGGKPIDRAMAEAGITPVKVQGRRFTDEATLAIVVQVLQAINTELVHDLHQAGGSAIGWGSTVADQFPIHGERLFLPGLDLQPTSLGFVGRVTQVHLEALHRCLDRHTLPVLPCLATEVNDHQQWLNINADSMAAALAAELKARSVLFLTDTPGVLLDRSKPESLQPQLSRRACQDLIAQGIIDGGMIPKVEACFEALDAGATEAVILDGRQPGCLIAWLLGEPAGTVVVA